MSFDPNGPPEIYGFRDSFAEGASDLYNFGDPKAERHYQLIESIRSGPQTHAESVQEAILEHIKERQEKLASNEELQVTCYLGPEIIRVCNIGIPNWHVLVLMGVDAKGNETSFIMDMHTVQLCCKVLKVEPPHMPVRIGFILPTSEEPRP